MCELRSEIAGFFYLAHRHHTRRSFIYIVASALWTSIRCGYFFFFSSIFNQNNYAHNGNEWRRYVWKRRKVEKYKNNDCREGTNNGQVKMASDKSLIHAKQRKVYICIMYMVWGGRVGNGDNDDDAVVNFQYCFFFVLNVNDDSLLAILLIFSNLMRGKKDKKVNKTIASIIYAWIRITNVRIKYRQNTFVYALEAAIASCWAECRVFENELLRGLKCPWRLAHENWEIRCSHRWRYMVGIVCFIRNWKGYCSDGNFYFVWSMKGERKI